MGRGKVRRKAKEEAVQPKLKVGEPGDKYEQEADAVADRVVSHAAPDPAVQMQPDSEEETMNMMPDKDQLSMQSDEEKLAMSTEDEGKLAMMEDEEKVAPKEDDEMAMKEEEEIKKKPAIQRRGDGAAYASPAVTQQVHQTKGQGQPMGKSTQQELGGKMGADFSNVRVHTDERAAELNESLGSKAFAHGQDIYFNKGNYDPGSTEGKRLLAHELTHTMQQGGAIRRGIKKGGEEEEETIPSHPTPVAPTTQPAAGGAASANPFVAAFQDGKKGVKFSITIYADQPGSGGDRDAFELSLTGDVDVGHSFISLTKENDDGSVVTRTFGFYPATPVDPLGGVVNVAGQFQNDMGHAFEKSKSKTLSEAEFDAALTYIDSVSSRNYDLNTYNCTDFAIEAAGAAGFVVPETHGTWPINGGGANPGDLGQDL